VGVDSGLAEGQPAGAAVPMVDARGARGVQAGSFNTQINYYYGVQTWAAQPTALPLTDSPYRGLSAFEAEDEQLFFGRDEAISQVLERLSGALERPKLVALSGVSGAGKSSLLRAGILPRLRRAGLPGAEEAARWPCLLFTPGQAPLDELAVQAASLAGTDAGLVRRSLAAHPAGFALTARQAALARQDGSPGARRSRLLLVVDQFEQLFTVCPDEQQRRAFVSALYSAATARQGPEQEPAALVVLGVRADFEARCADYPELTAAVQDRYLLTAMTARQLRIAITAPATKAGSSVDPELTELLLQEIGSRQAPSGQDATPASAGALPLLSHALDQAWRNRAGSTLTLDDYERTGGIETAVARSAEQAYGALTPAQQAAARRVFTRLTATGLDGTDTAVPAATAELAECSPAGQFGDVAAVLDAFAAQRLLTLAAGTVEITHEVLLTAWPLLRDQWLADTRADRMVRTRLAVAAAEWRSHSRDPAYLFGGTVLETATAVAARSAADPARYPPLTRGEQAFLGASGRARRRRAQRRQAVVAALTVLAVALAVVAVAAVRQRDAAVSGRTVAASDALAAESQLTGSSDPVLARLEAVAAWHLDPASARAGYAMLSAAALPEDAVFNLPGTNAPVGGVAFSPDGKLAAITSLGGTQLWNVPSREEVASLPAGGSAVAFSPGGTTVAIGTASGAQLWDVSTRRLAGQLSGGGIAGGSVAFSPDGALLAVGLISGPVQLWDVASRKLIATFPAAGSMVAAFSPDGTTLAVGDGSSVQLWRLTPRRLIASVQSGSGQRVDSVAFSPGGALVAISVQNGPTRLVAVASRHVVATLPGPAQSFLATTAFNPDGTILAVTTAPLPQGTGAIGPTTTRLWTVPAGRLLATLPVQSGTEVDAMAFSPDGSTLATGDQDGSTWLWNVAAVTDTPSATLHEGGTPVDAMAFSPDGGTLAVGTGSGVQFWNAAAGRLASTLPVGSYLSSMPIAFSPDGSILAVGRDHAVQLWNVPGRRLIRTLTEGSDETVGSVAFSPDGTTLAVACNGNPVTPSTVQLWDEATGRLIRNLPMGRGLLITSMAFSPDGAFLAVATTHTDGLVSGSATRLWKVPAGQLVTGLTIASGTSVESLAYSSDGSTLAVGTANGTQLSNVSDLGHAEAAGVLPTEEGGDAGVAFAPGAPVLAIAASAGIQLWDSATGQQIIAYPAGHGNAGIPLPVPVAFSRTGALAVATSGGTIQVWRMPYLSRPASYVCSLAGQPFPPEAWSRYANGLPYQGTCPS
jgi:WD40 repeat protein